MLYPFLQLIARHLYSFKATILIACALAGNIITGQAQNLIPNPGFEEYSAIPLEPGEWDKAKGWDNLNGVSPYSWPYGSPDYLRSDAKGEVSLPKSVFGYIHPHSGAAIMGLVAIEVSTQEYREYLSIRMIRPLVPGNMYDVRFYVSNSKTPGTSSQNGSDGLGIAFSTNRLVQREHELINCKPIWDADTIIYSTKWTPVSFHFIADSAYAYFTIGNFKDDAHTHVKSMETTEPDMDNLRDLAPDGVDSLGNDVPASYSFANKGKGSSYFFLDDILVKLSESATLYNSPPDKRKIAVLK